MNNAEKARQLLGKYLSGACTDEEKVLVERFYLDQFKDGRLPTAWPGDGLKSDMWKQVSKATEPERKFLILSWSRVAAVIALFVLAGAGLFFLAQSEYPQPTHNVSYQNDVLPGRNKAMLVLSNGRQIDLSSEKEGVSFQTGELAYIDGAVLESNLTEFVTLTTPRGGHYQVVLPDGSHVWLNAASSLRYPTSFNHMEERRVQLTGEGYFEVAKDPDRPFTVESDKQSVQVLGTHFNISAYSDESAVRTTLAEGSIKVTRKGSNETHILRPGQEAVTLQDGLQVEEVDPGDALAWKNGLFQFNREPLESIMRKLARWYDVEVVFEDQAIKQYAFVGVIDRFSKVSEVLDMLQVTGKVKFRIEEKKIIVSAK